MGENNTELIIYQTEDGKTKIDVHMENETVWLSLDQMAELFQRDKSTISKHIKNIFAEGELTREAVVANFATTATDGKTYQGGIDFPSSLFPASFFHGFDDRIQKFQLLA